MKNLLVSIQAFPGSLNVLVGLFAVTVACQSVAGTVSQSPLFLTNSVKPNVMIMMDNSGSMSAPIVLPPVGGYPFDATKTYPLGANCSTTALPATNDSYGSGGNCIRAGGVLGTFNSKNVCKISYSPTTIPGSYWGRLTGTNNIGQQCFSQTKIYKTNSASTTSLSAALVALIPPTQTTTAQIANWLNYYYWNEVSKLGLASTRLQVVKNSATTLLNTLNNDVRVGFATYNGTDATAGDGARIWEAVDDLTEAKKTNIKNRIAAQAADTNTPLAETTADIGRYFATGSSNVVLRSGIPGKAQTGATSTELPSTALDSTAWRTLSAGEPTFSSSPIQYRCQKSFQILLTDGLPTLDRDIQNYPHIVDYDGDCTGANAAQCTVHDMKRAYAYPGGNGLPTTDPDYKVNGPDGNPIPGFDASDYWDDVTQALFEMDLRPDLRDPIKESSAAKNNLTSYVVGFADSNINPVLPGVNPLPKRAAEEGGGKFIFAGNEGELSASLVRTFQSIKENVSASSAVATNSAQFKTDTLLFQAVFDSSDWSGDLQAFNLLTEDTNGNGKLDIPPAVSVTEDTNGNGVLDTGAIDPVVRWHAKEGIPSYLLRKIFSWNANAKVGVDFSWDQLTLAQKNILDITHASLTGPNASPLLNYLKGDQTNEGSDLGDFRVRGTILGDIVNSDPLFVGGEDLGYGTLPGTEGNTYGAHVSQKESNPDMLYVGANDGMLHALLVDIKPAFSDQQGEEKFAYVPNAVISPELVSLADRTYTHKYLVDGPTIHGDAYWGSSWHSVIVGSMGAGNTAISGGVGGSGGSGIFALDVTDPINMSKTKVLWEFTSRDDSDLGHTFSTPSVVRLADGKWYVIVGNGFNSPAGKSILFIINAQTGVVFKKITLDAVLGENGLATPVPVDVDNNRIIDYIYAGDLKGNLWKIDVSNSNPASWGVAYGGFPVFVAKDAATPTPQRQAITSRVSVAKAKAKEQTSGQMIFFGTGKYYEDGDQLIGAGSQVHTFYGIWDKCDKTSALGCNGVVSGRSGLVEQKILNELNVGGTINEEIRITSNCEVPYGSTAPSFTSADCPSTATNRLGWFIDLKSPAAGAIGERAVSNPVVRGNLVVFTTLITTSAICEPDGTGWFMEMDISGSRFISSYFDLNKDGKVDIEDNFTAADNSKVGVTGIKSKEGIIESPTIVGSGAGKIENKYLNTTSSVIKQIKECPPEGCSGDTTSAGVGIRRSWWQIR